MRLEKFNSEQNFSQVELIPTPPAGWTSGSNTLIPKKFTNLIPTSLFLTSLILLVIIVISRYKLGLVRYFDTDEYSYLNWAYHILRGNRPYLDFMLLTTPLYLLFSIPIVWFWHGIDPMIVGRVVAFFISILLAGSISWLFWEVRRSWVAIVAAIVLLVIPMPSDKFLEIRPDNLAILLFILGLTSQVKWMKGGKVAWAFLSGLLYGFSLLTLQKMLPFVVIAAIAAILATLQKSKVTLRKLLWMFTVGGLLPVVIFLVWAFLSGNPGLVLYSVTKLPIEHSVMYTYREYGFFYFYPNIAYYGPDWTWKGLGIVVNHTLWIVAISMAIARLFWAIVKSKDKILEILLVGLLFSSLFVYKNSPIKFPQYLMPSAIFVSFFVADAVFLLWIRLRKTWNLRLLFSCFFIIGSYCLLRAFFFVHTPKFLWTNKEALSKMEKIFATIQKSDYVLDLDGRTLYYPYPYYVCCLPFEDFRHNISMTLPSVKLSLIKTGTKYIYQGEYDSIHALATDDIEYIQANFKSENNGELLVSKVIE